MPVVPFCRNPTGVVPSGKSAAHSGPSPPTRGTLRDRYETWAGDAMAVSDRSARDRADERLRCGRESTWSRHPDADAKSAAMIRAGDGGQKAGAPRRARHKRENHRAGKAGSHRLSPWFLPPAFFSAGGPWVRPASGLPCASALSEVRPAAELGHKRAAGIRCHAISCLRREVDAPGRHVARGAA